MIALSDIQQEQPRISVLSSSSKAEDTASSTFAKLLQIHNPKDVKLQTAISPATQEQQSTQELPKNIEELLTYVNDKKDTKTLTALENVELTTEKKEPQKVRTLEDLVSSKQEIVQEKKVNDRTLHVSMKEEKTVPQKIEVLEDEKVIVKASMQMATISAQMQETQEPKYIKSLVEDAKVYLKQQITIVEQKMPQSQKTSQLPQTLQGLVQVAKDLKIDVAKISVEEFSQKGTKALAESVQPKEMPKNIKSRASFQAYISTQEIVDTKNVHIPQKNDISLQTAKVIGLQATAPQEKVVEKEIAIETPHKTETIQVQKTDTLDVKIHEAKQMVRYLSQDVKNAIENYKAPFTRIKVQLNPQKLGEVELTVVQRGKNLHVNLSSNNSAINTLALHVNDLKMQFQHNGIQNASFNFNGNAQQSADMGANSGNNANAQQQNREQAQREYNYFDINEETEEIQSSLEIVVPNYA